MTDKAQPTEDLLMDQYATSRQAVITYLRMVADRIERNGAASVLTCVEYRLNPTAEPAGLFHQVKAGRFHVLHVIWEDNK